MMQQPSKPEMQQTGQYFEFVWRVERVKVTVDRIRTQQDGTIVGDIKVQVARQATPADIYHSRVRLTDGFDKWRCAQKCANRVDDLPWEAIIETACIQVVNAMLSGEPIVRLSTYEPPQQPAWRIYPFLPEGKPTVLFGLGGSMKSLMTAYFAVRVAYGIDAIAGNALVLDWESDAADWQQRIRWICNGMGLEFPDNIHHRFCEQRLADDIDEIKKMVLDHEIDLVVVDSAGMAVLGDVINVPATMSFFTSLRALRCTALIIGHQNADEKTKKPFGNLMWENQPRLTFQIQKAQHPGETTSQLGLFQRKVNAGMYIPPIGFEVEFNIANPMEYTPGDSVTIGPAEVKEVAEFQKELPLAEQVEHYLNSEGESKAPEIAEALGKQANIIRSTLDRMFKKGKVSKIGDKWVIRAPEGTYREVPIMENGSSAEPPF